MVPLSRGGHPPFSMRATAFLPTAPYKPPNHKCCLHSTIHDAIPPEHRLSTYMDGGEYWAVRSPWSSPSGMLPPDSLSRVAPE